MTTTKEFLEAYPLTIDQQRIVDLANNGNVGPLTRVLSSSIQAVCTLRARMTLHSASSTLGLIQYYRNQIAALISLVNNKKIRDALKRIYEGN